MSCNLSKTHATGDGEGFEKQVGFLSVQCSGGGGGRLDENIHHLFIARLKGYIEPSVYSSYRSRY